MLVERIIGVFKLDANTFEEIEHDQNATAQAAIVVAIVAIINAISNGALSAFTGSGGFIGGALSAFIGAFVGWFLWSIITYFLGTTLFDGEADLGEMLRVVGFAYAPQMLGIIPCVGWIIGIFWTLAAMFIAIRQGLDIDDQQAAITTGCGCFIYAAVIMVLGTVLGVGGAIASGALG